MDRRRFLKLAALAPAAGVLLRGSSPPESDYVYAEGVPCSNVCYNFAPGDKVTISGFSRPEFNGEFDVVDVDGVGMTVAKPSGELYSKRCAWGFSDGS